MAKKISRIAAIALIGSILFSQPVFADYVSDMVSANGSYISSTGPSSSSTYTTDSITVYKGGEYSTVSGPGINTQTASDTVTTADSPGYTEAAPAAASGTAASSVLTIPDNIAKPQISSEAAILIDSATGEVLFEKNADEKLAPASTTKLLTALLAVESLSSDSTISFSSSAVNNLESGAATVGMVTGDTMSFTDALNAVMIRSACEVANAIAEAVSGSQSAFAELMNKRALELGCTNSNFVNASGLNNDNHYSTVRDMALIGRAALNVTSIRQSSVTKSYTLPATSSRDAMTINNTNKFVTGDQSIDNYLGGKTGYTSKAGFCLVSCLEAGGRELIAVVFKAASSEQYADTKALLEFGQKVIAANASGTAAGTPAVTVQSTTGTFVDAGNGDKKYQLSDGTYLTNEWLDLNGETYFFGSDSIMCKGWRHFTNGSWYYFDTDGKMVTDSWVILDGKSYYMQSDGVMAVSTIIDGKYQVDENGVYVKYVA